MKVHAISVGEIMKQVKLEVELKLAHTRWYAFRLWCGVKLIRLATRVMGCGVEFTVPADVSERATGKKRSAGRVDKARRK